MRVKTAAKRDAILAAAAEVFKEAGFEGASMAEISARSGGSKGTLYAYFKSKEDLFVAVAHEEAKKELVPAIDALGKEHEDLATSLCVFGERTVNFLCQHSSLQTHRMILAESGRSNIGKRFHEEGPEKGMQRVASFMQELMNEGRLMQADPILATQQLFALLSCETVVPMMHGIENSISRIRIKHCVARAVDTFLNAYVPRSNESTSQMGGGRLVVSRVCADFSVNVFLATLSVPSSVMAIEKPLNKILRTRDNSCSREPAKRLW